MRNLETTVPPSPWRSAISDAGYAVERQLVAVGATIGRGSKVRRGDDAEFEDLVVSLNTVSVNLQGAGYGDRLLCEVFAFEEKGRPIYFIYNFKRGGYYPFVPTPGDKARDSERELRLKAQLGPELPFEEDVTRWFPLWEIPL